MSRYAASLCLPLGTWETAVRGPCLLPSTHPLALTLSRYAALVLGTMTTYTFYQNPCVPHYWTLPLSCMRLHVARRVSRGLLTYHTLLSPTAPSPAETKNPTHVHVLETPNEVYAPYHASLNEK